MPALVIDKRYSGPPNSSNGGYICGRLASYLPEKQVVTVTLWQPPPLERLLSVQLVSETKLTLHDSDEGFIAEAQTDKLELELPTPPSLQEAQLAAQRYSGFQQHPFPSCFVCGPQREVGDGLRIFAGSLEDNKAKTKMVASPWLPDKSLLDGAGLIKSEFIWAALDCPGAFAAVNIAQAAWPILLGRFTVKVISRPQLGSEYVVMGWLLGQQGRKYQVATALLNLTGECIAMAQAVWIEPRC